jgi:hypothetical protein
LSVARPIVLYSTGPYKHGGTDLRELYRELDVLPIALQYLVRHRSWRATVYPHYQVGGNMGTTPSKQSKKKRSASKTGNAPSQPRVDKNSLDDLLIDEADALSGKRSEVKDAHDR